MHNCSHPELKNKPQCKCDHQLTGTGAVFLQGSGWLLCNSCGGIQKIRKSMWETSNESRNTTPDPRESKTT